MSSSSSSYLAQAYDIAVYELEMAGEVALKALLINAHLEVPKKRDVSRIVRTLAQTNDIVTAKKIDIFLEYLDIFDRIVKVRGDAEYSYESTEDLDAFREFYVRYEKQISHLVEFVSDVIGGL
ncbi:MAG: HEPN domain-containing protein [Candidatus Thermoplasmatota archaeon]|nr:HEPN domain-containing protein [Candidatus Thermoplasmatota archaeon]MCL5889304.1 HEPN domain-containing protein [Candidatus Thermoplasmatota archaeon]